jgi:glycosyltransferase involved in cell wall biosynthesis
MSHGKREMVSVCMAVFNGERYVREQLDSILAQLTDEDEVIIVDDCSRDRTVDLIQDLRDSRIAILRNQTNVGPVMSFERAIARAKGRYIFLSDQDDIWKPNKVASTCEIFESTDCLVVVSDANIVTADRSESLGSFFSLRQSGSGFWRNLYKNGFIGCCMALRFDAKSFMLPFPVDVGLHDEWIGLCSSIAGRVIFSDQQLIDYRRHEQNYSQLARGSLPSMIRKRLRLMSAIATRLPQILRWRACHGRPRSP